MPAPEPTESGGNLKLWVGLALIGSITAGVCHAFARHASGFRSPSQATALGHFGTGGKSAGERSTDNHSTRGDGGHGQPGGLGSDGGLQ